MNPLAIESRHTNPVDFSVIRRHNNSMNMTRETMVERMQASDKASDGLFIVAVKTTGIYCLPSCRPARKPKPENVEFYATPEQAKARGFRACKLCKPDDFYSGHHADEALMEGLVAEITRDPGAFNSVNALADAAGVSLSRLHGLFRTHYHATPADVLTRLRIAAARKMLLSSDRQVGEIAYEIGFESLSAFNENFRRYAAISPLKYRQMLSRPCFDLSLPDGYPTSAVLRFLGRDQRSLTERVQGHTYTTAFRVGSADDCQTVLIRVEFAPAAVRCHVVSASTLSPAMLQQAHECLLATLGLSYDPARFESHARSSAEMSQLVLQQRGLRVPLIADTFDGLVWAIAGQQITLAFAATLRRRLVERVCAEIGDGIYEPPAAAAVARLEIGDLTNLSFSQSKAQYLIGAARLVRDGQLPLMSMAGMSTTRIERTLREVRGIGPWSANYLMMRCFGFLDCVPVGDTGLTMSLKRVFALEERPGKDETMALMNRFSPYRTLATFHLWHSLHASDFSEKI